MGKKVSQSRSSDQKWVVGIDPFSELDFSKVIKFANTLAQRVGAHLQGVYVLAPESLNWTGDFSGAWMKEYYPLAQRKAEEISEKLEIDIEVAPSSEAGLKASVRTLLKYAKSHRAGQIVISTHARRGIERWTVGSFAESLILQSEIPVLVVNPSYRLPSEVKRILLPTDLGKASEHFALKMARVTKTIGAEMDLFYKQPDPLDPMIQQGVYAVGGGWVSVQNYLDGEINEKKRKMARLIKAVQAKGVKADACMDSTPASLVDSINTCAKQRKSDLIILRTQAGAIEAAVLGSVARGLVRSSEVPILIYR